LLRYGTCSNCHAKQDSRTRTLLYSGWECSTCCLKSFQPAIDGTCSRPWNRESVVGVIVTRSRVFWVTHVTNYGTPCWWEDTRQKKWTTREKQSTIWYYEGYEQGRNLTCVFNMADILVRQLREQLKNHQRITWRHHTLPNHERHPKPTKMRPLCRLDASNVYYFNQIWSPSNCNSTIGVVVECHVVL